MLFEIAFCFRCQGVRAWGAELPDEVRWQTFDAASPAALELLKWFQGAVAS
ncbi:hypothetical protein [Streptomyces flavofungini]|uniref:hypothetical protein n=1 Tax=Streptomyces flavofungini TaxID=68200 RepID=UPI0034DFB97F